MGTIFAIPNHQKAFAHTFSGDESASFIALVESIRSELDLVQSNIGSNVSLAEEHASHAHQHLDEHTIDEISERNQRLATDLPAAIEDLQLSLANSTAQQVEAKIQNINDLLSETVSARVESDQMNNSTVWALVLANMADGVLTHYSAAYGVESEEGEEHGASGHADEEGSGNMTEGMELTETSPMSNNSMTGDEMEEQGSSHGNMSNGGNATTIVDEVHYQSAQGLASRTLVIFNERVKSLAPANSTEAIADLEAGLEHLIQAIDDREPLTDVEVVVHSEVHPNLQTAFNLQVIPEFPLPLLMIVTAIGGIIAATRVTALRRK
ncbi:MAG TPA: hypothetical protein VF172_00900 [Nitrososphaera sp.]|jgi:hypothetical protein